MLKFQIHDKPKSRIAPTPSGYLHLGNAYSFILAAILVRAHNGMLHLRIDDLDAERKRPEFLEDIFSQLEWLGIQWDSGPSSVEEFERKYSQHLKLARYKSAINQLINKGLVYACECTRSQIQSASSDGTYPGTCRAKNLDVHNAECTLRMLVPDSPIVFYDLQMNKATVNLQKEVGDFVIRRKGGLPAYQLASVVDDEEESISLIVRGEDLLTSSAAQIFLAKNLGACHYLNSLKLHHPLLLDTDSKKLSKSHASLSLKQMRQNGASPADIYRQIAQLMGMKNKSASSFEELLEDYLLHGLELRPTQRVSS